MHGQLNEQRHNRCYYSVSLEKWGGGGGGGGVHVDVYIIANIV